jgi:hypothetical protein
VSFFHHGEDSLPTGPLLASSLHHDFIHQKQPVRSRGLLDLAQTQYCLRDSHIVLHCIRRIGCLRLSSSWHPIPDLDIVRLAPFIASLAPLRIVTGGPKITPYRSGFSSISLYSRWAYSQTEYSKVVVTEFCGNSFISERNNTTSDQCQRSCAQVSRNSLLVLRFRYFSWPHLFFPIAVVVKPEFCYSVTF